MQPHSVLRFEQATAADLEDPLAREMLEIAEPIRLAAATALRIEQQLERRLGPWVVAEIGRALGLGEDERKVAIALAGYLAQRDQTGRFRAYADVSTAGLRRAAVSPDWYRGLSPGEAQAIAVHRELDRQILAQPH